MYYVLTQKLLITDNYKNYFNIRKSQANTSCTIKMKM